VGYGTNGVRNPPCIDCGTANANVIPPGTSQPILSFCWVSLAITATMLVTYLSLAYAKNILKKIGPQGIDAATRIVGFFVSAMGVGLIFHGMVEFLQSYGVLLGGIAGH
jgi:multiple antibiotic resistance protein